MTARHLMFLLAPALMAGPLQIRTSELPWAAVGSRYDAVIETAGSGTCPLGDVGFSLAAGNLPRGVELAADGLHGTPREVGEFRFWVRAANACTQAVRPLTLFVSGKPILRTVPEEIVFEAREGGPDPEPQMVQVSSTWPNLAYSVWASTPQWLTVRAAEGVTPERGGGFTSDTVWLDASPGKLMPGVYHSKIYVAAWGGSNAPVIAVTLKVLPAAE